MGTQSDVVEFYEPELVGALQEVFDRAWKEINATLSQPGSVKSAEQRRNDLAQMILLAHRSGMQPEQISTALRAITSSRNKRHAGLSALMSRARSILTDGSKT
jgi:hypothetical protein